MDIRQITETYFVAPQLESADFSALAEAGISTVICNRPDAEVPPSHQSEAMKMAAEAAGIAFHEIPLTHQTMTPDNIARHRDIIQSAAGATLAYCASGTRSTIAWALGQAGKVPTDEIITAARAAGYDISNLQGTLDAIAAQMKSP